MPEKLLDYKQVSGNNRVPRWNVEDMGTARKD